MRKNFIFIIMVSLILILSGCSSGTNDSGFTNPAEGMQVATVSGHPGQATSIPTNATASPNQNPGATILLRDEFSDPTSGWEVYSGEYGRTAYEQGGYLVESLIQKEYNWGVAGVDFTDVRIEVDVSTLQVPSTLNDGFGVDCRIQSNGDGYGFRISSDGYAAIVKYADQEGSDLYDWTESGAIFQDGRSNHLTAICAGNHFSFYVNNVFIAEVVDDTYSSGDIALSTISFETEPSTVLFDNIIVQQAGNLNGLENQQPYQVNFINTSDREVCWIYITDTNAEYWGDSWLTAGETLAPEGFLSVNENFYQVVDVQVLTCDYVRLLEEYNIDVSANNTFSLEEPALLQRYEFNSLNGWSSDTGGGTATITQGEYYSLTSQQGGNFISGEVDFTAQNIVLRTDASLAQAGDDTEAVYGVMCRVQDDGSGILFAVRSDGYGSIQKWDGLTISALTDWVFSDYIKQGINANYIEGDCIDNTFTMYVNGGYITDVQNADFSTGRVGVGLIPSPGSATHVDFDFVEVFESKN